MGQFGCELDDSQYRVAPNVSGPLMWTYFVKIKSLAAAFRAGRCGTPIRRNGRDTVHGSPMDLSNRSIILAQRWIIISSTSSLAVIVVASSSQIEDAVCVYHVPSNKRLRDWDFGGAAARFVLDDQYVLLEEGTVGGYPRLCHIESGRSAAITDWSPTHCFADIGLKNGHLIIAFHDRVQLYRNFLSLDRLVVLARAVVPRCLEVTERRRHSLQSSIPAWCVSGRKSPFVYLENFHFTPYIHPH